MGFIAFNGGSKVGTKREVFTHKGTRLLVVARRDDCATLIMNVDGVCLALI